MTDSARRQRLARHWRDDLPFGLPSNFNFDVIRTKRDVGSMMAALPNADRGICRTQAVRAARSHRPGSVRVATGDTKVLRRGKGGGLYLATTGLGIRRPGLRLDLEQIRAGDAVMVSGPVGDHGTAVLLAREDFGLKDDLASDAASVLALAQALWDLPGLRFMRDPTRGGLVSVMHEIAYATGLTVRLEEYAILSTNRFAAFAICWGTIRSILPARAAWSQCLQPNSRPVHWISGAHCPAAKLRRSSAD